jgi:hypothetical protein
MALVRPLTAEISTPSTVDNRMFGWC